MQGYRGALMDVHGNRISLGEKGISAWKREVAAINREAREVLAANAGDARRLTDWRHTETGEVMHLVFSDPDGGSETREFQVEESTFRAGMELLGREHLGPGFFVGEAIEELCFFETPTPGDLPGGPLSWAEERFVLDVLETSDPETVAIVTGYLPEAARPVITSAPAARDIADLARDVENSCGLSWADQAEDIAFLPAQMVSDIAACNGRTFMPAAHLPGTGLVSVTAKVFEPMITSTSQRPAIRLNEDRDWRDLVEGKGYRLEEVPEAEGGLEGP
ncbi:MAG: hypothetical protein CMO01_04800 [Thalassobius sp.]|nr:hypothetical protein [Thalassovita sp.]